MIDSESRREARSALWNSVWLFGASNTRQIIVCNNARLKRDKGRRRRNRLRQITAYARGGVLCTKRPDNKSSALRCQIGLELTA